MIHDLWDLDFWDGIESGFPLCCILFFCTPWTKLRESKRMFSYNESFDWKGSVGVGYVQCPECIIKGIKS